MAPKNRSPPRQKGKLPSLLARAAATSGTRTSPKKSSDTLLPFQNLEISEVSGSDKIPLSSSSRREGGLHLVLLVLVSSLVLPRILTNSSLLIPRSFKIRNGSRSNSSP